MLSPGGVLCSTPGCEWEKLGGTVKSQLEALVAHKREHGK